MMQTISLTKSKRKTLIGDSSRFFHILYGEGDIIDENGFMTFADILFSVPDADESESALVGIAFGFDANGKQPSSIYRNIDGNGDLYFCDNFTG